jgi:hypothetical protein
LCRYHWSKDNSISVVVIEFHPEEGDGAFYERNTVERLPVVESQDDDDEDTLPVVGVAGARGERERKRVGLALN